MRAPWTARRSNQSILKEISPGYKPKEEHIETQHNQTDKIKGKDKILKATREKQQITYKGTPIRLSADFSAETLQARRGWGTAWSDGREDPTVKNTLPSKTLVQI